MQEAAGNWELTWKELSSFPFSLPFLSALSLIWTFLALFKILVDRKCNDLQPEPSNLDIAYTVSQKLVFAAGVHQAEGPSINCLHAVCFVWTCSFLHVCIWVSVYSYSYSCTAQALLWQPQQSPFCRIHYWARNACYYMGRQPTFIFILYLSHFQVCINACLRACLIWGHLIAYAY